MTENLGQKGEELARDYLRRQGYRILAQNFRTRFGEIDLIATKEGLIIFVEVKTRIGQENFGQAEWALSKRKIRQVQRLAEVYLTKNQLEYQGLRIDAITIILSPEGKIVNFQHWQNLTTEI